MKQDNFNYPRRESDTILARYGYDLLSEYRTAVKAANLCKDKQVLDVATGSGRMAYTLGALGYNVISGDFDKAVLAGTIAGIGHFFPGRLSFTVLDALEMPLPNQSYGNVVSANALHEIDDPMKAISEMTRVVSAVGTLMIMDFNENGFDVISKSHRETHGKEHRRGTADYGVVKAYLESHFQEVRQMSLGLNYIWTAKCKRISKAVPHSRCFACGRENQDGLDLQFRTNDDASVACECTVSETYQGYSDVVQGGIVSTILDSAMTNCLFKMGIEAMTARLNVKFRYPVYTGVPLKATARLLKSEKRVYDLEASIQQDGKVKALATARFMPVKARRQEA